MIYTLTYEESEILGFRIFSDFNEALKEYFRHCVSETKTILAQEDNADDTDDMTKCTLDILKLENKEYESFKEYEYEHFQLLIEDKDDIETFLTELEEHIEQDTIPQEIINLFPVN